MTEKKNLNTNSTNVNSTYKVDADFSSIARLKFSSTGTTTSAAFYNDGYEILGSMNPDVILGVKILEFRVLLATSPQYLRINHLDSNMSSQSTPFDYKSGRLVINNEYTFKMDLREGAKRSWNLRLISGPDMNKNIGSLILDVESKIEIYFD